MPTPQRITFVLDDLFTPETREMSDEVLGYLLSALTALDVAYLKAHPGTPLIYESGVVYQEEPPGAEDWANIPMILKLGWGDCLPLDTLILTDDYTAVPFGSLCVGDKIVAGGEGVMSTVLEACVTEEKPILAIRLESGRVLRCSADHKSFLSNGTLIRARDMAPGMRLKTPSGKRRKTSYVAILSIHEEPAELVGDIRTDTGRFYLPESDVITSNCEELACWRAAELQIRGLGARAGFTKQTQPDGTMLYHIVVLLPDGRTEDPSRQLGMR